MMNPLRLRRIGDGVWEARRGGGKRVAVLERIDPPNNSHMSLWIIRGRTGHFPTRRDAVRFAPVGCICDEGQPPNARCPTHGMADA